jgi:hypothetical protein
MNERIMYSVLTTVRPATNRERFDVWLHKKTLLTSGVTGKQGGVAWAKKRREKNPTPQNYHEI